MRIPHRSVAAPFIGSSNIYRDLGFPDADEMLAKAQLVGTLSELVAKNFRSLPRAATRLKCSRRRLTTILRGHFRQVSTQELATAVGLLRAVGVAAETSEDQKVKAHANGYS